MIITVTPNPAVDQTMFVDGFEAASANRARATHEEGSSHWWIPRTLHSSS